MEKTISELNENFERTGKTIADIKVYGSLGYKYRVI